MQQARQSTGTRPYPGHSRHCEVHSARQAFSSISTPPSQKSNRLIGIRSFNNGYRTTCSHSSKSDVASDHKSTGTPGKYIRLALSAGALLSHDKLTALLHFLENRPGLIRFRGCPGFSGGPAQCRVAIMHHSEAQDRKQRERPQHSAERHPHAPKLWNLSTGKRSEMWPEEPVVAKHASPRNDEEAFQYPLERPVSFRTTNIGGPTFQAHQGFQFHGHLLSVLSFLLSWVDLAAVSKKAPQGV